MWPAAAAAAAVAFGQRQTGMILQTGRWCLVGGTLEERRYLLS